MKHHVILPTWFMLFFGLFLAACAGSTDSDSKSTGSQSESKEASQAPAAKPSIVLPDCEENSTIVISNGGADITVNVVSALAVNKIKFNEQTDVGDVAKPGYTICIADFELDPLNPWARPKEGQHKVEVRVLTGDNSPVVPGVYRSAAQGNLQVAPLLYIGEKTHPVLFPKIGRVLISETGSHLCGKFEVSTIPGLKLEGFFNTPVIEG